MMILLRLTVNLLVSSLILFAWLGCGAFGLDDLLHGLGVDGAGDEAVADHEARCAGSVTIASAQDTIIVGRLRPGIAVSP